MGKLTETACRRTVYEDKTRQMYDGGGLYLEIRSTGKLWRWKYRFHGADRLMALGSFPIITLQMARDKHIDGRRLLDRGVDPMAERKAAKVTGATFREVAELWYETQMADKSARYRDYVKRRLKDDVYPFIGDKAIRAVKAVDVVAACKRIEQRKAYEIARRVKENCSQILRWAVGHGYIEFNPVADIKSSDVLRPSVKGHHARVEEPELPSVVAALYRHPGIITRMASKLTMYTALRTANVIGLEWAWVNLDAAEIRFPGAEMKMRSDFICVLSAQAVDALRAMKQISSGYRWVFPGAKRGKSLSSGAMLKALRDAGFGGLHTMHAFRAVFTTWARENSYAKDVVETSLHHHKRGVSAHYDFAAYLPERRVLAQAWSDNLDSLAAKGNKPPERALDDR
jgi:integrase